MKELIIMLVATVTLLTASCADQIQDETPATPSQAGKALSIFPDLPSVDKTVYDNIKKTCGERWQLERMNMDTFEVIPEEDGYLVKCDGIEGGELYHYVIRVDSNGNWINDGRTKKTP
jgi:hypothetical protein